MNSVNGKISGLNNATVYDVSTATVNGIPLDIKGATFDAEIENGSMSTITGLSGGVTINSAPNLAIITDDDGDFTFGRNTYRVNDTIDGSVTFQTDENSEVANIDRFAGEISGAVGSLRLNGKEFGTNNGNVTVSSDGEDITEIIGLVSGNSIGGDLDNASFFMPEGRLTINGAEFELTDDDDGAQASNGGKVFTSVAKDASLKVGADGSYRVNNGSGRAKAGDSFTVNRDGGYLINNDYLPIIEKTPAGDIRGRSIGQLALVESSGSVGAGNDSVVVRNNANVTADVGDDKETLIIATTGNVTLENYSDGNAAIGSFEYTYLAKAIKTNAIKFGDGVMTLGDAVITFDANAKSVGATKAHLVNAVGNKQAIGFTHTAGGTLDASKSTEAQVLKGNYAENSTDTQKSGGSNITGGLGNDTILIGAGDTANGGAGDDQIYITDSALREGGAVIVMSRGSDTVHNFSGGYTAADDEILISDLSEITFDTSSGLVMRSGDSMLTFSGMGRSADLIDDMASSADLVSDGLNSNEVYRLKLRAGSTTYNAAVAQRGQNIRVSNDEAANVFYGENSGVNFSEYTGAVSVNLGSGMGNVGGTAAQFHGIDKVSGGVGSSTLIGAAGSQNTLIAGTGGGEIWSSSGNDLMVGNSADLAGSMKFNYLADDGQDTITGFDFMTSATDVASDWIDITTANAVTEVWLEGSNVMMRINQSENDYLTLAQGAGKDFRINNLIAKVADRTVEYDGFANCYVANGTNATMTVAEGVVDANIWLNDLDSGLHGTYYLGDIKVLDGSNAVGSNILTGNYLDNIVIGGTGLNSIWGGYGYDNDILVGGNGQNTFFFALVNGHDTIQNAHDGDVIDLSTVGLGYIANTAITESGVAVGLVDGSVVEVQSNAAIEYKTADGSYVADHASGQWIKKG